MVDGEVDEKGSSTSFSGSALLSDVLIRTPAWQSAPCGLAAKPF